MANKWIRCEDRLPDTGVLVETKADGRRTERPLKRKGSLWFVPDGSLYVYYAPTHWRYTDAN